MSKVVILGLAVVWAIVLAQEVLPKLIRGRRADSMMSFRSGLNSLERSHGSVTGTNVIDLRSRREAGRARGATGRPASMARHASSPNRRTTGGIGGQRPHTQQHPHPHQPGPQQRRTSASVRKRRQDVLVTLGAAAVLTLLATIAFGGPFLYLNLLFDLLFAAYLCALWMVGATTAGPVRTSAMARRSASMPPSRPGPARTAEVLAPRPIDARRIAN